MKDVLIIGQGIAGSFLAWELIKAGKDIIIVDDEHKTSSSRISAGIINPVTGKRFALTDDFDTFYKYARKTYRSLENTFQDTFFEEKNILRIFQNKDERDHWNRKDEQSLADEYYLESYPPQFFSPELNDMFGSVMIKQAGFCHTQKLLSAFKTYYLEKNILKLCEFKYDMLDVQNDYIVFKDEKYATVVFCEGYRAQWNPWFDWLDFNSVKGEILKLRIEHQKFPNAIINKGKWCAQMQPHVWTAGATYFWDELNCEPTRNAREEILLGLQNCFQANMEIVDHKAGVRPVLKDQKPVLGCHPQLKPLAIFNGLGSKGFLTGPRYAMMLADVLIQNTKIPDTLSPKRFLQDASLKLL